MKDDCVKTREMLSFLALINDSVTIGFTFFIPKQSYLEMRSIFFGFYLDCILECFYKYHPYHLSIQ